MKLFLFFISGFLFITTSFSQSLKSDSLLDLQHENLIGVYNRYTDGNAPIYNGSEYLNYTSKLEGDPFFASYSNPYGWISYKGIKYGPLSIQYDITRDEVVILFPDSISKVVLHNEFIDSFYLGNHTFIQLRENQQENLANSGFYDVLYSGHVRLLARRMKTMEDVIRDNSAGKVFYSADRYYLFKGGLYYLVDNKKDVFRFVGDKKHEIRIEMRKAHLKFHRKDFESVLIKVTALYDQIIR